MNYCSDIINLQALYGVDRSEGPRRRVQQARKQQQALQDQLDKLMDAMLATADEGTPLVFAKKARELESQLQDAEQEMAQAERELASVSRLGINGADTRWRELAAGVEAQDPATRLQARQLVADTFERIVVYHHGIRPDPDASERDYQIDLLLLAKGGHARMLRVNRDGSWVAGEEVD